VHLGYQQAFATSLHTVFLVAVPISAVAFGLSWLLKEVPLRKTSTATNQAQTLAPTAAPAACTSLDEMASLRRYAVDAQVACGQLAVRLQFSLRHSPASGPIIVVASAGKYGEIVD
jgi:hypothetical protein